MRECKWERERRKGEKREWTNIKINEWLGKKEELSIDATIVAMIVGNDDERRCITIEATSADRDSS